MDGVTVLSSYTEYISGPGFDGSVFFLLLLIFIFLILSIAAFVIADYKDFIFMIIITFAIGIITIIAYSDGNPHYSSYTVYKVTVDKSVSFTEFIKQYEIIGEDGSIYIVKDRAQ